MKKRTYIHPETTVYLLLTEQLMGNNGSVSNGTTSLQTITAGNGGGTEGEGGVVWGDAKGNAFSQGHLIESTNIWDED